MKLFWALITKVYFTLTISEPYKREEQDGCMGQCCDHGELKMSARPWSRLTQNKTGLAAVLHLAASLAELEEIIDVCVTVDRGAATTHRWADIQEKPGGKCQAENPRLKREQGSWQQDGCFCGGFFTKTWRALWSSAALQCFYISQIQYTTKPTPQHPEIIDI